MKRKPSIKVPTISLKALSVLGKKIDPEFVWAKKLSGHRGLYWKLNTKFPHADGWRMLCGPRWIGEFLVAFVCKPRTE